MLEETGKMERLARIFWSCFALILRPSSCTAPQCCLRADGRGDSETRVPYEQDVLNLLTNAIRHAEPGSTIEIGILGAAISVRITCTIKARVYPSLI